MKAHQPALRGNEILTHAATWMNLGNMMLSEINQPQNDKYYTIPLIQGNQNRQIHGDKKQNSVISVGGLRIQCWRKLCRGKQNTVSSIKDLKFKVGITMVKIMDLESEYMGLKSSSTAYQL